jgi:hypothetical protein
MTFHEGETEVSIDQQNFSHPTIVSADIVSTVPCVEELTQDEIELVDSIETITPEGAFDRQVTLASLHINRFRRAQVTFAQFPDFVEEMELLINEQVGFIDDLSERYMELKQPVVVKAQPLGRILLPFAGLRCSFSALKETD